MTLAYELVGNFRIDDAFPVEEWADRYHSVVTTHVRASAGETTVVRGDPRDLFLLAIFFTRLVAPDVDLDRCGRCSVYVYLGETSCPDKADNH